MSEAEVKLVVNEAFEKYEKETGLPRHNENLDKFDRLFTIVNKVWGAVIAVGILVGLPGAVASILIIISKIKGH